ncbi:MAG: C1 family peptidase [Gloeomargarita sp. SKYBB_i_bin120]|nr:hypothetical protein [Gloeomargarita sp. SKYB120]MDW8177920.1 C1 family peptidase [Gloeomargarita sp. SKYBB_i_bin120]
MAIAGRGRQRLSQKAPVFSIANLSEQQILSYSGADVCELPPADTTLGALQWMVANNLVQQANYPYEGGQQTPCKGDVQKGPVPPLLAWGFVTEKSSDIAGGNLVGNGTYEEEVPQLGDRTNHAVQLVGWDDKRQAWRIKNSWETGWGDGGYGSNNVGYWTVYATPP